MNIPSSIRLSIFAGLVLQTVPLGAGERDGPATLEIQVEIGQPEGFAAPALSNARVIRMTEGDDSLDPGGPVIRIDRIPERLGMEVPVPSERERWKFELTPLPYVGGDPVETLAGSVSFPVGPGAANVPGIIRIPCDAVRYRRTTVSLDGRLSEAWGDRTPLGIYCFRGDAVQPFEVVKGRFPLDDGCLVLNVIEGSQIRIEAFPSSPFRHRQLLDRFAVGEGDAFRDRVEWSWTEPVGIPLTITIGGEQASLDGWTHASIFFRNLDDGTRSNLLVPIRDGIAVPISLYQIERSSGARLPIELFSVRFSSEDADEAVVYRVGKPVRLERESFEGDEAIRLDLVEEE